MTYLIDSDWLADYLKGRPQAYGLLSSLAQEGLAMSVVTYGEIYEGIYYGRDPRIHEQGFRRLLRWVDVLPLHKPIMRRFARVRGDLRRNGNLIGDPDIFIAATALYHDLTLVTRNLRDFQRIPNLKLYQAS